MDKKLRQGIDAYLSGDFAPAATLIREYLEEGGDDEAQGRYYLGLALYDTGKLLEAVQELKAAVSLDGTKAMYHYRLGIAFARLMLTTEAIAELERALELNNEHQRARYMLGTLHFKNGDLNTALRVFENITDASPDFAAAYFYQGLCYFHLGKTTEAKQAFVKTLDANPEYIDAYVKLGKIALTEERYDEAEKHLNHAFERGMRDAAFLYSLLRTLKKNGKQETVVAVFEEARRLYPNDQELVRIFEGYK